MLIEPGTEGVLTAQVSYLVITLLAGRINCNTINGLIKKFQDPTVFGALVFTDLKPVPISGTEVFGYRGGFGINFKITGERQIFYLVKSKFPRSIFQVQELFVSKYMLLYLIIYRYCILRARVYNKAQKEHLG